MKVVLVEDDPVVCSQVKLTLQAIPGTELVKEARTAQDAKQWLAQHPQDWDLAVVDVFVQQGRGFELLRCCHDRAPHQRAVVLSNYSPPVDSVREYAMQAGADAVFDHRDMEALVVYFLEMNRDHARHDS